MILRLAALLLVSLVLLNQVVAGIFAGGTVICVGATGGLAVQAVGMTCCVPPGLDAEAGDPCCAGESPDPGPSAAKMGSPGCDGCRDYLVTTHPSVSADCGVVALPPPAPLALIAVMSWPRLAVVGQARGHRDGETRPPPLRFLRTIVLRV